MHFISDNLKHLLPHQQQNFSELWNKCTQPLGQILIGEQQIEKTTTLVLTSNTGEQQKFQVYISQNHLQRKGWAWKREPVLRQHYQNHLLCEVRAVTATPVACYWEQQTASHDCWRALLLIELPAQWQQFASLQAGWGELSLKQRQQFMAAAALQIVSLHKCRLSHHQLNASQLLYNAEDEQQTCLNQLQTLAFQWRPVVNSVSDLAAFIKSFNAFDAADTEYFLQQYWRDCVLGLTYQGLRTRVLAQMGANHG